MTRREPVYVYQRHHIIYESDKQPEKTYRVRKGVHQVLTLLKRYKTLSAEEIHVIKLEAELKRIYE